MRCPMCGAGDISFGPILHMYVEFVWTVRYLSSYLCVVRSLWFEFPSKGKVFFFFLALMMLKVNTIAWALLISWNIIFLYELLEYLFILTNVDYLHKETICPNEMKIRFLHYSIWIAECKKGISHSFSKIVFFFTFLNSLGVDAQLNVKTKLVQ